MIQRLTNYATLLTFALLPVAASSCMSHRPDYEASNRHEDRPLHDAVQETVHLVKLRDPAVATWFDSAYGYAVFPGIGAGGFIVGGGYGTGEVYADGEMIGRATVTQLNVGATVGGQVTREIIFFRDKPALDAFMAGGYEFDAAASAVLVKSGAGKRADYNDGVAVFVLPTKGAMVQASLGTQKFSFTSK